jgi:hypothetical protein
MKEAEAAFQEALDICRQLAKAHSAYLPQGFNFGEAHGSEPRIGRLAHPAAGLHPFLGLLRTPFEIGPPLSSFLARGRSAVVPLSLAATASPRSLNRPSFRINLTTLVFLSLIY